MQEKGNLSINSENFMPIIKKWLYTDKDIFIRELVSNACDAVTKLQKLSMMGEADIPAEEAYEIHVVLDQDKKTLQIIDNGIGMTADEIKKYINQIAFSGATDFLSKFEGKTEDEGSEIIGHFGLGFYSAFMVADTVEIDSLSYRKGAEPAKWRCNGGIDYEMEAGERTERGTTITLFIGADGEEFLNEATLYAAMRKYCAFMPVPIFVDVLKEETEEEKAAAKKAENTVHVSPEEAAKLTTEGAMDLLQEQQDAAEEAKAEEPKPLNDTNPLWQRKPSECTDEDYKAFYHQVFNDLNDPLFWIHLNMDYPFRLKGILYFPKLVEQMDMMDGEVKLYCNQVYIADNVKEVVPEFLLLLKGILDCPDMPLNVSRSALQNDGYVEKMMSVSGLSHAEIETEFDRFLLLQAGKDPLRAHLTQHIHPTRDRARVIADFFPTLTTEQIFQALCSMIRYHKLLRAPGMLKRSFLLSILKISGNYADMHGLLMRKNSNPACQLSNNGLSRRFGQALHECQSLTQEYLDSLEENTPLSMHFMPTFGAGDSWKHISLES